MNSVTCMWIGAVVALCVQACMVVQAGASGISRENSSVASHPSPRWLMPLHLVLGRKWARFSPA